MDTVVTMLLTTRSWRSRTDPRGVPDCGTYYAVVADGAGLGWCRGSEHKLGVTHTCPVSSIHLQSRF